MHHVASCDRKKTVVAAWRFAATASVALACSVPVAAAANVYVSEGMDGSPRYASQPLDASYHLLPAAEPPMSAGPPVRASARATGELGPVIASIARRHGLSAALLEAVVAVESGFDPRAISAKGAVGAMQLMPATGRQYGLSHRHQYESPEENIDAGARHLKDLLARHGGNVVLALAAYNAGSGSVQRHGRRIPPYRETMLYVAAVLGRAAAAQP